MKLSMPMEENSMDCESLNKDEFFFELGDFSFEADGSIQIAYSSPDITAPIYLYQVDFLIFFRIHVFAIYSIGNRKGVFTV